jgi:membrane-bound metal-dependent hydrolase YbcI (DUF457 family)
MKGITHFAAGVAVASCFPYAVRAGMDGNPLYFLLGGCCALLPDTIDFKFSRFFHRHDVEIAPDPLQADAGMIAQALADALAAANEAGRTIFVKLNTIRLGSDRWQRYTLTWDTGAGHVAVDYGAVVDTGTNPLEPVCPLPGVHHATAPLGTSVTYDYQATVEIDAFDGPALALVPQGARGVDIRFLPWHRAWSHSLVAGLLLALAVAVYWGLSAGVVACLAYASHVLLDQLGFMGSNLFAPFTRQRHQGLGLAHSMSVFPNLLVVWGAICLVFWNLARLRSGTQPFSGIAALALVGVMLPLLCFAAWRRLGERWG